MGANLVQYGLGLLGINRVKNPLSLKDGELTVAQNAGVSLVRARAGIRKRKGLGLLLDGAGDPLLAVLPIPLDDWDPGDPIVSPSSPYPPFPPRLVRAPYVGPTPSVTTPYSFTICWEPLLGADFYKLFVSKFNDFSSFLPGFDGLVVNEESCCHECDGLDPSTTYYYYLQAWNVRGASPDSDPGEGDTDPLPPPPSTGTWEVPLVGTSGWADAIAVFLGSDRYATAETDANETISATFSPDRIALNGGLSQLASGLPAGFTITSALAWIGTYKVGPGSYGGFWVSLTGWGVQFAFVSIPFSGYPASVIGTVPAPQTLARVLGAEVTMAIYDPYAEYPGENHDLALGGTGPQIHLYGTYSISG